MTIAMGFGTYFRNIKDALATIADGMAVTASHMIRKPVTLEYPDRLPDGIRVQDTLPFRYRGILEVRPRDLHGVPRVRACVSDRLHRHRRREGQGRRRAGDDSLRHRHGEMHVLRPLQRAVSDRVDPPHARVRGRRLLAREPGAAFREVADAGVQAEEGRRGRPRHQADPRPRDALHRRVRQPGPT
jgi:hypothetical protein